MADRSVSNDNIRVAPSLFSLRDIIKIDVENPSEKAYWYIKFNIPLNKAYVNKETTNVTDTDGYIMRTYIYYDENENLIVVVPLDSYEQNRYYLLNISKDVRSKKGQKLKNDIHVLFKLLDNKIAWFEILKRSQSVPKPRPRPADYDEIQKNGGAKKRKPPKTKLYSFEKDTEPRTAASALPYAEIKIKIAPSLVGLVAILIGLLTGITIVIIICTVICLAGMALTLSGIFKPEARSNISYNNGVRNFNNEKYKKANKLFKKALNFNEDNEKAELALEKVSFYL